MCKAFDDHMQTGYKVGKMEVIENMLRHNMTDELIMTIAECTQEVVDEARKKISS